MLKTALRFKGSQNNLRSFQTCQSPLFSKSLLISTMKLAELHTLSRRYGGYDELSAQQSKYCPSETLHSSLTIRLLRNKMPFITLTGKLEPISGYVINYPFPGEFI
ncbi:hypothetical protein O181_023414 [Austropuccinia psidii MF-1]|uniref:Uncharacterized protein n=1 Tax=Austropuccinia psidii MF-1 TaxID=1389203 RepID=A0A9Q3GYM6_9BASI|nr:hypothetical protein [Austropuccinia psidii MF-1]